MAKLTETPENARFTLAQAAERIGVRTRYLIRWMHQFQWIQQRHSGMPWIGQRRRLDDGHLVNLREMVVSPSGIPEVRLKILVTPNGVGLLRVLMQIIRLDE